MSVTILTPYHGPTAAIILPDPDLGNTKKFRSNINVLRAMDNSLRVIDKSPKTRDTIEMQYGYSDLGSGKFWELVNLVKNYGDQYIRLIDWNSKHYKVRLYINSVQYQAEARVPDHLDGASEQLEIWPTTLIFVGDGVIV